MSKLYLTKFHVFICDKAANIKKVEKFYNKRLQKNIFILI